MSQSSHEIPWLIESGKNDSSGLVSHPDVFRPTEWERWKNSEMTASEIQEQMDKVMRDQHKDFLRSTTEELMKELEKNITQSASISTGTTKSPPLLPPPKQSTLVDKIHEDYKKLMTQGMRPKHLYLGRQQWVELRSAIPSTRPCGNDAILFAGFEVYTVDANDHYVMTGE